MLHSHVVCLPIAVLHDCSKLDVATLCKLRKYLCRLERVCMNSCSSLTGNASPFCFANCVHLVFDDANHQNMKCLRRHAQVGLFV